MGFWHVYMGIYGGGSTSADGTGGTFCHTNNTVTATGNTQTATDTGTGITVNCG